MIMGGSYSDFSLCLNTYNFQKLESLSNNYILMATSMECDNILIMNNSDNWLGTWNYNPLSGISLTNKAAIIIQALVDGEAEVTKYIFVI